MKWSQPADRRVIEAVVAAFSEPAERLHARFAALSQKQWRQSYYWLDASGMALYFLARIESIGFEDQIPSSTLARLNQNRTDNKSRYASMFSEYVDLNRVFQAAGIDYCNLKGFTLSPDSCPDPVLRCQLDLDFLVDGKHLKACSNILSARGYCLRGSTDTVLEFKTDGDQLADIADFYKPKPQRCVEIHFACEDAPPRAPVRDGRLDRLAWHAGTEVSFPSLCSVEQFIGQAVHLFTHLCGPHTRLAWVLEFKRHIEARAEDLSFWSRARELTASDKASALAVGVCSLLVEDLFSTRLPAVLGQISLSEVPEGVALWVRRYGRRSLLADFPGTKLNLLLREEVNQANPEWKREKRKFLIPLNRPPRIVHFHADVSPLRRWRGEVYQLRYDLFRLRFHLVEGIRYTVENARWRRYLKRVRSRVHQDVTDQPQTAVKHT